MVGVGPLVRLRGSAVAVGGGGGAALRWMARQVDGWRHGVSSCPW